MDISIWYSTGVVNCKVYWCQFRPTHFILITSTSSLAVILHNIYIYHDTTQSTFTNKWLTFSLNIPTTRKLSLVISWIQWMFQFSLWFFQPSSMNYCTPILPSASGMQGLTPFRSNYPPSVFDTSPSPGSRLATQISLMYELLKMCCPLIKSIKYGFIIEDSGTTSFDYFMIQHRISCLTHTSRDVIILSNKINLNGPIRRIRLFTCLHLIPINWYIL